MGQRRHTLRSISDPVYPRSPRPISWNKGDLLLRKERGAERGMVGEGECRGGEGRASEGKGGDSRVYL